MNDGANEHSVTICMNIWRELGIYEVWRLRNHLNVLCQGTKDHLFNKRKEITQIFNAYNK